jgi:hypothetical protein
MGVNRCDALDDTQRNGVANATEPTLVEVAVY